MCKAVTLYGVTQGLDHSVLPNEFRKCLWPIFARQNAVCRSASRHGHGGGLSHYRQIQTQPQCIIRHIWVAFGEFWGIGIGHYRHVNMVIDLCRSPLNRNTGKSRSRMTRSEFVVAASVRI